ncbi:MULTISPECIES: hypothetical protein [unclassified Solibacillus]|uniref:hypothetical protein n=1 Tax=unclassified Solibacillus TaxID=2637870 RepID=UPI0030F80388
MVSEIGKRILVGVIATFIFCVALAIIAYTPVSNREPNTAYISLTGLFIIYAIYSGPVFIIAGVIWSFVIDKISVKHENYSRSKKYLSKFICYILAGIVSTLIFLFIITTGDISYNSDTLGILAVGIIASLLYYHLQLMGQYLATQY